jgi:hypothetical protein
MVALAAGLRPSFRSGHWACLRPYLFAGSPLASRCRLGFAIAFTLVRWSKSRRVLRCIGARAACRVTAASVYRQQGWLLPGRLRDTRMHGVASKHTAYGDTAQFTALPAERAVSRRTHDHTGGGRSRPCRRTLKLAKAKKVMRGRQASGHSNEARCRSLTRNLSLRKSRRVPPSGPVAQARAPTGQGRAAGPAMEGRSFSRRQGQPTRKPPVGARPGPKDNK